MTTISIVTPWLNGAELIEGYEQAVALADQVIIIDNGSRPEAAEKIVAMSKRLKNCLVLRNDTNRGFSAANNQGLAAVTSDYVVFLNADVEGDPRWVERLRMFIYPGGLFGASLQVRHVDGIGIPYLEGWCLCGKTDEVLAIGGWNEEDFPGLYYEDNEFCWRAGLHGLSLVDVRLPLRHLANHASKADPSLRSAAAINHQKFTEIVRRDRG